MLRGDYSSRAPCASGSAAASCAACTESSPCRRARACSLRARLSCPQSPASRSSTRASLARWHLLEHRESHTFLRLLERRETAFKARGGPLLLEQWRLSSLSLLPLGGTGALAPALRAAGAQRPHLSELFVSSTRRAARRRTSCSGRSSTSSAPRPRRRTPSSRHMSTPSRMR